MRGEFLQGIVPGDLLKFAGAARAGALDGMGDTVGMIKHLQTGLTADAELSAIDGMLRVAFEFFREAHLDQALLAATHDFGFALHHPHQQAAACRAQGADARLPCRDAGNQLFFREDTDKLLLRAATAFERRHDAGESRDLYKVTPFHKSSPAPYALVMASLAIDRDFLLCVAIDTKAHVQIHLAFGCGLLRHIAMAHGAIDP